MAPLHPVVGVSLVVCLVGAISSASAALTPSIPPTPDAEVLASASPPDSSSEERKKQVSKSDSEKKEQSGGKSKKDDSDEDDGGGGGFFSECFGSFLVDLFTHDSDTSGNIVEGPPPEDPKHGIVPEAPWSPGVLAMVLPADSSAQGVMVWDQPGGEGMGAEVVSHLPIGSDVIVRGSSLLASGTWVEVSAGDAAEPAGWVAAEDLVTRRTEELTPLPGSSAVTGTATGSPLSLHLTLDLSAFHAGPKEVGDEYVGSPWRLGVGVAGPSSGTWQVGFTVGYSQVRGTPQFNYVTPSQKDYPYDSRLQIVDLGVDGGQDLHLGRRWNLAWSLGPTLNWVQERARVRYERLQGGTVVAVGRRDEVLVRWRAGADATASFGIRSESGLRVGLLLRAFVIPWHSNELRSLTLDFIGDKSVAGGSIGIYIGI